jgi:hypothetical protein
VSSKRLIAGVLAVGTLLVIAATSAGAPAGSTAYDVALARAATAKYVDNLPLAQRNGYGIITKMIPNMGYHFMNPKITGFDVSKPPILVYEHHGSSWQLGAVEWVFTKKPATPPLPGATYGAFGAGCHYKDGTFFPAAAQSACPAKAPGSGAAFNFWHPNLITLHMWVWYPNPSGIYSGTNPLVSPFDEGAPAKPWPTYPSGP